MPVSPALERWRQKDHKFKGGLVYIASSRPTRLHRETLSKKKKKTQTNKIQNK
jgi:hypothetical protein